MDHEKNIKVCDFGFATDIKTKKTDICGTYEYMAPEMVNNSSYNEKVDVWSLGILLYELIHGKAPFSG